MRKSTLLTAITIILCTLSTPTTAGTYSGGSGTEIDPYQISDPNDWVELTQTSADWASHFILTADIDLADVNDLLPVAPDTDHEDSGFQGTGFSGSFDGDNHVVSNVKINLPNTDYVGLFGCLVQNSRIRNLGVEQVTISGKSHVGGLVGSIEVGTFYYYPGFITNCSSTGLINGGPLTGGLVGGSWGGNITNSYSTATVHGSYGVGGLVGDNREGQVTSCYSTGSVTCTDGYCGGLIGNYRGSAGFSIGAVMNCYATGSVTYKDGVSIIGAIGGLIGVCWQGHLENCYSTGPVSGTPLAGGMLGYGELLVYFSNCFYDIETSEQKVSGVGTGMTTAQMQMQSTFTDWDFENVWTICEGMDYPRLQWQTPAAGDFTCPDGVQLGDFYLLSSSWITEDGQAAFEPAYDLDSDGVIGIGDLKIFTSNWLNQ